MGQPDPTAEPASAGLRIIEFYAENVKRLEVVCIRPRGDMVEITGKNGQGKTSVLDAIWWALTGAGNITAEPIRRGATEAIIQLDLGDLIVRRVMTLGEAGVTQSLSVRTREGAEYRKPQQTIDKFFNALSLDPLAFLRMDAKEKFTLVRQFVPDVDFDAVAAANKADYDARTFLNADAKQHRTMETRLVVPNEADLPATPIDLHAIEAEIEAAGKQNAEIEGRRARREGVQASIETRQARHKELTAESARLRAEADEIDYQAGELAADIAISEKRLAEAPPLPEPIVVGTILARLNAARGTNTAIDVVRQRHEAAREAAALEAKAAELTKAMKDRLAEVTAKIAQATLPVDGLALTPEGGVQLDGFPFEQASDAQQLRASMELAMALNPRLKVLRVRDGSLLDSDSMALVTRIAGERGYQVWIERIESDSPAGFELVAGRLREPAETVA